MSPCTVTTTTVSLLAWKPRVVQASSRAPARASRTAHTMEQLHLHGLQRCRGSPFRLQAVIIVEMATATGPSGRLIPARTGPDGATFLLRLKDKKGPKTSTEKTENSEIRIRQNSPLRCRYSRRIPTGQWARARRFPASLRRGHSPSWTLTTVEELLTNTYVGPGQ